MDIVVGRLRSTYFPSAKCLQRPWTWPWQPQVLARLRSRPPTLEPRAHRVSAPRRQAHRDFGASGWCRCECDARSPTQRCAVATRRADQPSLDATSCGRFACVARWHARIRTQASVSRSRRWHASSKRECVLGCISPIGATSRCASASAARGRSRQWLGAVPAAEVRTASRSPLHLSDIQALWHSGQGPLGPSCRASEEPGHHCQADPRPERTWRLCQATMSGSVDLTGCRRARTRRLPTLSTSRGKAGSCACDTVDPMLSHDTHAEEPVDTTHRFGALSPLHGRADAAWEPWPVRAPT